MSEHSLIDRLDALVDAVLADRGRSPESRDPELDALAAIAVDLLGIPQEGFRERLRAELESGRRSPAIAPVRMPEGFHTITPYLIVEGGATLIDFLAKAFDAQEKGRVPRPDGTILHAELQIGDSALELADGTTEYPPMPTAIHFYVPDADAVYRRALAAGGVSVYEPVNQVYGDREAGVTDPSGNQWYIATHQGASHVPEGLRSVTPYLHARGADKLIDFVKEAFGAEEAARHQSPEGVVLHAKVRIGDSILELGEARGEHGPTRCAIHLYVADSDAVFERAVRAGATPVAPVADQHYGERSGVLVDPFGNPWFVATYIGDVAL
jgi:PhnB protein